MTAPRTITLSCVTLTFLACPGAKSPPPDPATDAGREAPGASEPHRAADPMLERAEKVIEAIEALETTKDVTCWTSFRQLDFFVATRQYSAYATLTKIAAIKSLSRQLWRDASTRTDSPHVSKAEIEAVASVDTLALPKERRQALGELAQGLGLKAYEDYRSTSEDWRVLLALVQDAIRSGDKSLKPLDDDGAQALTESTTRLSLELLTASGELAVVEKSPFIEARHVRAAHRSLAKKYGLETKRQTQAGAEGAPEGITPLTGALIKAKVRALRHYNASAGSIRQDLGRISRVPIDPGGATKLVEKITDFARFFTENHEPMRADNYLATGSTVSTGERRERAYIDPVYVENTVSQRFPHLLMANGDVLLSFEPNPGVVTPQEGLSGQEIRLLDHQMNAVRDTAIHWIVLERLHAERPFAMDPFAAEVLSEAISMAATLYLRRAQTIARRLKKTSIDASVIARIATKDFVMVAPGAAPGVGPSVNEEKKAEVLSALPGRLFEDVTRDSGLPHDFIADESLASADIQTVMGAGVAVGDLNGDGYPDLFLAGEGLGRLFINEGDKGPGRFRDETERWGIPGAMSDARGTLFFDLEGDGDLDLLVLRSRSPSVILENKDGRFEDTSAARGFRPGHGAHTAVVFDADGDADLDIFVGFYGAESCNNGDCSAKNLPSLDGLNGTPNQLWLNEGARFVEAGRSAGLDSRGWTLAAMAFDHDADGDPDLHIANDFGANSFYENIGGGRFKDISALTGTADRGSGMNVSVTDVNADGQWDFYITNIDMFSKNIKVVYPTDDKTLNLDEATLKSFRYISGNKLYVHQKGGGYAAQERERLEGGDRGWSWAGLFFDLENDGDEDLYLSNGWIAGSYAQNQRNQLLVHDEGRFFVAEAQDPWAFEGNSRSVVASDLDRDGDLDLVVNNFRQAPVVLKNLSDTRNRWIGLKLEGKAPNTRALGARVKVSAGQWSALRAVSCGSEYLGQQDGTILVGVGKEKKVRVEVRWPSGQLQRWTLSTNQFKTLVEGP